MSKHSSSPAKSEEPNKKHKPEDQQTPSWAQEILREMKDLKSTLGTKCDEAKISADQAKQSANDTKKAFTSMESKIQDLERRLQILEAKPPSPSPNPQSSATLRARSQGAHVTEDEEQKRLRTAVVTGWNRDSMSKTVLQDVDELLKSLPRKIDVKVSTPGPRCSMAFLEFQDVESMIDFLQNIWQQDPARSQWSQDLLPSKQDTHGANPRSCHEKVLENSPHKTWASPRQICKELS